MYVWRFVRTKENVDKVYEGCVCVRVLFFWCGVVWCDVVTFAVFSSRPPRDGD